MTDNSPTELERRALDAMLRAKWIRGWSADDAKGVHVDWDEKGIIPAVWLKAWGERLDILADPSKPFLLTCLVGSAELSPNPREIHSDRLLDALRREGLMKDDCSMIWIDDEQTIGTPRGKRFCGLFMKILMDLNIIGMGNLDDVAGLFSVCMKWSVGFPQLLEPQPYQTTQ